jgi:sigma-B regulation protein RsbU (phosphoserine phosphatase)
MRIRSKLLSFLLVIVLVPLCSLGWYSWRQTTKLGSKLADNVASELESIASKELVQSAEMLGENCSDTLNMLETSLTLIAEEAARDLSRPSPKPTERILLDTDFDAGAVPPEQLETPPYANVPCSYEHLAFHLPPGLAWKEARRDAEALSGLLPVFRTILAHQRDIMAFGYVGLTTGLHVAYPGHGGYPPEYDPRSRLWFQGALKSPGVTWSVMVDAVTGKVMATMSMVVASAGGPAMGVAGLDIPMGGIILQSDMSKAFSDRMRTLVLSVKPADLTGQQGPLIVAARNYDQTTGDWKAPVELSRLSSPDQTSLDALTANLTAGRSGVQRLPVNGQDSLLAYAPIKGKNLAVALLVPRAEVVTGAAKAETIVLFDVKRLMAHMGWFIAAVVLAVVVMAYPTSRAVTRPVLELAAAARRLAAGDFGARAPARGSDELADLSRSFNEMAPHLLERIRLKNDMALAMEVQQHLLPPRPPGIQGLDVAARSDYCDETGGDYFDFLDFSQNDAAHTNIVVGDVTGHGISAALFMASGRALLRGRAMDKTGPARLLTEVNRLLCEDTRLSGRFITVFFLRLDLSAHELVWSRAGHDPGLLYDPVSGKFEILLGRGIPLGVEPEWTYTESRRPWLAPGQILLLYTDGIHEAVNADNIMYGRERLQEVVALNANATASGVVDALFADLREFKGGLPLEDDVTLVVIKAAGPDESNVFA